MNKKNLILLTDSYPKEFGELFIDDEMKIISDKFENILIITAAEKEVDLMRFIPNNAKVVRFCSSLSFLDILRSIPFFLKIFFSGESTFVFKKYKIKFLFMIFKIMIIDVARGMKLMTFINDQMIEEKFSKNNTIYYSYWNDYKALSLALLKNKNKNLKCISRIHRWDVYADYHKIPYLPFKLFMFNNLSGIYSISDDGKKEYEKLISKISTDKIHVSRLGKINNRSPLIQKINEQVLICSCSNITPIKRINLIIDILCKLKIKNLKWVHFGDGYLKDDLIQYANSKIANVDFDFKGILPNHEILNFYNENYVDLFINVSESEGIPVSIMEALSAGIPVIATDVGATSEVIQDGFGFLLRKDFQIDEAIKIIDSFFNFSIDKIENYRLNSFEFWKENYNAEKNYNLFVETILSL